MKVIIAGSRHMPFSCYPLIPKAVERFEAMTGEKITEVVCGLALGADTLGKKWAVCVAGLPVKDFPADWDTHGMKAGPIRNGEMAEYADGLIVFIWDGSRGSANMLKQMQNRNKPCYVVYDGMMPEQRLYFHPESDCYFTAEEGDIGGEPCDDVTDHPEHVGKARERGVVI